MYNPTKPATVGKPTPAQRKLLELAADGPVELTCFNAKSLGACLRREWVAPVKNDDGTVASGLAYELTEDGLDAVTA